MFVSLIFVSYSISAFSQTHVCKQFEAQVVGEITHIKQQSSNCQVQIKYDYFNSSVVCSLDASQVSEEWVDGVECTSKVGDKVSGVLVSEKNSLRLER